MSHKTNNNTLYTRIGKIYKYQQGDDVPMELNYGLYEDGDGFSVGEEGITSFDGITKVTDLESATRYAYGLAKTREEIASIQDIAEKECERWKKKIDEVNAWKDGMIKNLDNKKTFLEDQLLLYHMITYKNADEKQRKKLGSIKLPYGVTLQSRKPTTKYDVTDEHTYKIYADIGGYMKPPKDPEVDWAALKKDLQVTEDGKVINKQTGELLEFIQPKEEERKFEIK